MSNPIRKLLAAIAIVVAGAFAAATPALADITVDVNQAALQPLPIAIPSFGGGPVGQQISDVVTADLDRSGLFRPLDPASFRQNPDVNVTPQFDAWKAIAAQALLVGSASIGADGRLSVSFRLWDVYAGEELGWPPSNTGMRLTATPDSWRTIAHQIADKVYEKLTGEPGYFDTRVVFVAETGPRGHRVTRLEIMDQDGANPSYLPTDASANVYAPRFSMRRQEITYISQRPDETSIYLKNLDTGREEVLGRFPNMTMTMAPRFSPDDSRVVFAADRDGATNIYVMDLATHQFRRLTNGLSIDTSPSYSPDGGQIVFNSDRGGSPELYVMGADGGNVRRISFGSGRYTAPVWSPDGKLIAFVKQEGQVFSVGVMAPDGSGEHILASSYFADDPTWAPNGRVLMFERKLADGESRLWVVDVTGHILKQAPNPVDGSDPTWSPLLH